MYVQHWELRFSFVKLEGEDEANLLSKDCLLNSAPIIAFSFTIIDMENMTETHLKAFIKMVKYLDIQVRAASKAMGPLCSVPEDPGPSAIDSGIFASEKWHSFLLFNRQ